MRATLARHLPKRNRTRLGLCAGLVFAALIVRLAVAPLNLPFSGWIVERIAGPNLPVDVGAIALKLGLGHADVMLRNVRAASDRVSVSAEAVRVTQGLRARTVVVENPVVRVDPSGGEGGHMPPPEVSLRALDHALQQLVHTFDGAGLSNASVLNGRVNMVAPGQPISAARVFRALNVALEVGSGGGLAANGSVVGVGGRVVFDVARTVEPDGRALIVEARGVSPLDLAPIKPVQSGMPLSPRLAATWDGDGTPQSADFTMGIGRGIVKFGRDPTRELDSAAVALEWRAGSQTIDVSDITVLAGGSALTITGTITPQADAPWLFQFISTDALFDAPDFYGPPVAVTRMEAEGRLDFAGKLIHVDRAYGTMPTARADAVVTFDLNEGGPWVSGSIHVGQSMIPSLLGAWIPVAAYEPRIAMITTMLGGILREADITFALTKPDFDGDPDTHSTVEGAMRVDAAFTDATITAPELPLAIQRASGTMAIRDRTLRAALRSGIVEIGEDPADLDAPRDVLVVEEGRLTVDRLDQRPVMARATLTVRAPMTAAVRLANMFGVNDISGTPISPEDVDGMFRAKLSLRSPLGDDIPISQRAWSVEAELFNASSRVPIGGQTFANANVEVAINARRLAARGRAEIDGLNVEVNYSELFAGRRSGAARIVLTDADRKAQGFDTGDLVTGPVVVTIEAGDGDERVLTADLTEADVVLPGLEKPAGEPLSAEAIAIMGAEAIDVREVRVDGSGVDIEGSARLVNNALESATLDRVALSPGDEVSASVDRRGELYRIAARAKTFDARPLVASVRGGLGDRASNDDDEEAGAGPDVSVEIIADRVAVHETSVVTDLSVTALRQDGAMERVSASGRIDGSNAGSFAMTFGDDSGRKRLRADVTSLGRLVQALGIYERLRDGRTTLDAVMDDDGVMRGRLTASNFAIENERALDDLVRRAQQENLGALERNVRPRTSQDSASMENGIPFNELIVEFERRGGTIIVEEAILRGPVMGGTAEGVIDMAAGQVRLNGTFIPAYGVNNLFGRLPIFGGVLGGGRKGGLIGVTFRLSGALEDPRVSVNPISAIAPGIFRRIFEFR